MPRLCVVEVCSSSTLKNSLTLWRTWRRFYEFHYSMTLMNITFNSLVIWGKHDVQSFEHPTRYNAGRALLQIHVDETGRSVEYRDDCYASGGQLKTVRLRPRTMEKGLSEILFWARTGPSSMECLRLWRGQRSWWWRLNPARVNTHKSTSSQYLGCERW